ncbi:hypothetical protein LshimejAT787_1501900 [Lyophyllum shimeji]|uniref:Uncharacterized protein n=1 Tax=Lyophyllum shimeji TaxID=47721 RepID=A0A9P3UVC0_LYOSH|nr:hypothetical protein LshimejAT787_1501900 [Lyophyllum shimeji]
MVLEGTNPLPTIAFSLRRWVDHRRRGEVPTGHGRSRDNYITATSTSLHHRVFLLAGSTPWLHSTPPVCFMSLPLCSCAPTGSTCFLHTSEALNAMDSNDYTSGGTWAQMDVEEGRPPLQASRIEIKTRFVPDQAYTFLHLASRTPKTTFYLCKPVVMEVEFSKKPSDITFKSCDGVLFKLHKRNLDVSSGVLSPEGMQTSVDEVIPLEESSETLVLGGPGGFS